MTDFNLVPVTLRTARDFVTAHHRHNVAPQGHKFSVGIERDGNLVGVAIVGRPIARRQDDGRTVEVTRVCVLDDNRNANSALYGAAWRAARAMGYSGSLHTPFRRNPAPAFGPLAFGRSE